MVYSEVFSVKKVLLILAVSVASIYVGIGFGGLINGFSATGNKVSAPIKVEEGAPVVSNSWVGVIRKKTEADGDLGGEFKLVGEREKVIAVLQSSKIDLRFLEGMSVTIEGKRVRVLNNNLPLILVEKVKFK